MTFDEALAKLGLSRHTSRDEARRAYLRLLKTTRPEVDRDEFISLREAYDIVRALLPPLSSPESASGVALHVGAQRAEPGKQALGVHGDGPPPPGSDQLTTDDDPSAAEQGRVPVVDAALANSAEIDNSARPANASWTAQTPAEAAARMCQLFDHFGHDPGVIPPVVEALRLTLTCLAQGEVAPAVALNEKVSTWLHRSGRETMLGTQLLTTWVTTRELTKLAPSVPARVFAPIAVAALDGDLSRSSRALTDFRFEKPQTASLALAQMKQHAPWLAATVGDSLATIPVVPSERRWWTTRRRWATWPVSLLILAVLRAFSASVATTRESTWTPPTRQEHVSQEVVENVRRNIPTWRDWTMKNDDGGVARLKRALGLFFELSDSVSDALKSCQMVNEAALVRRVREEVRNGNCAAALATMPQLRELAKSAESEKWQCASEHLQAFDRSFVLVCSEAEKILPSRNPE